VNSRGWPRQPPGVTSALWALVHAGDWDAVAANVLVAPAEGGGCLHPDALDGECWSVLHYACQAGHAPTVRALQRRGANPNVHNAFANTPLYVAACSGTAEVCQLLLEWGTDAGAINKSGATALAHAAAFGGCRVASQRFGVGAPGAPGGSATLCGRQCSQWGAGLCASGLCAMGASREVVVRSFAAMLVLCMTRCNVSGSLPSLPSLPMARQGHWR
jgi:hypothetical protein